METKTGGHKMKRLLTIAVLLTQTAYAFAFTPVAETLGTVPQSLTDIRERTSEQIKMRAAEGYHYATVDMDGASWKEEKAIKKELEAAGYQVDFSNDHHTYGWNDLNGALTIRWVERSKEPLFGNR